MQLSGATLSALQSKNVSAVQCSAVQDTTVHSPVQDVAVHELTPASLRTLRGELQKKKKKITNKE